MTLETSTLMAEGVYQGSKYLKYQVLASAEELKTLFSRLSPFFIYPLTGVRDGNPISQEFFIEEYGSWIESLKRGEVPSDGSLKRILAAAFTKDRTALWKQEGPNGGYLIKMRKPSIQVQSHFFTYSPVDQVYRPMGMGGASIFWGLQFSFPQLYQDPKTMEFHEMETAGNLSLFQEIKQWVRDETRPTPFVADGKRTHCPIRLGKSCFDWIGRHPQLIEQKISVYG